MGWKNGSLTELFFRAIDAGFQSYDQRNNALYQESRAQKREGKRKERRYKAYQRINDGAFDKGGHHDPQRQTFEPWPGDDRYGQGGYRR